MITYQGPVGVRSSYRTGVGQQNPIVVAQPIPEESLVFIYEGNNYTANGVYRINDNRGNTYRQIVQFAWGSIWCSLIHNRLYAGDLIGLESWLSYGFVIEADWFTNTAPDADLPYTTTVVQDITYNTSGTWSIRSNGLLQSNDLAVAVMYCNWQQRVADYGVGWDAMSTDTSQYSGRLAAAYHIVGKDAEYSQWRPSIDFEAYPPYVWSQLAICGFSAAKGRGHGGMTYWL